LLLLASSGLVELEPHRGALVPAPQTADVVETYAVRRALGALVVRRAAQAGPSALAPSAPAQRALAELVRVGATGDAWAAGEADIRFQDALATGTGMRRIPPMFLALSSQIRLFTAVMGVRYAYSIPQMIHDDTMLLQHITERDEAAASRAWHAKMDDALGYMLTQLGSPGAPARR
jgi:DNA-binding GntR family transcriptional regulator